MRCVSFFSVLAAAILLVAGCTSSKVSSSDSETPSFAFISNGVADFWEHAEAGVTKAGEDFGVEVTVITPNGVTDQTRKLEDLLIRGVDGVAISPINSANQIDVINKAAAETNLITADSDAPDTNRLMYVGMDNYDAGLLCGKTLRDAMPDGGSVMILVGRVDQDNAARRCYGFSDGFLGREPNRNSTESPGAPASSESDGRKYTILGTMTDNFDFAKAKANAEDAMTRHPDLGGMVGLFEYNPPLILEALDGAGKLGQIKVMGFDENEATLQGIKDGNVVATVVQNPYQYGYKSIEILNELHKGNKSVIPENKFLDIPARVIDKSNVDQFWQEIKERLGR